MRLQFKLTRIQIKFGISRFQAKQDKYKKVNINIQMDGISRNGKTPLIIFRGKLNSSYFCELAEEFLLPFIQEKYPINHRLHMDNAPSHSSAQTRNFLNNEGVLHFKTPAQSPDLNPIKARLNWCKQRRNWGYEKWATVIFSDEANFELINRKTIRRVLR